jgi:hypothetical protein
MGAQKQHGGKLYQTLRCSSTLDAPGIFSQVMIRGIKRQKIFRDNKDREDFLDRPEKILPEIQTACYGWAFFSNHPYCGHSTIVGMVKRKRAWQDVNYVLGYYFVKTGRSFKKA